MILGIDASNIRSGGGLTHLKSILSHTSIEKLKFKRVIVWSNSNTLNELNDIHWIEKRTHPYLNKSNYWSFMFQLLVLKRMASKEKCDIVFVPGSTFLSGFRPYVTLSQNMLPFEYQQAKAYDWKMKLRLGILFFTQSYTFKRAKGLIFLTNYARKHISSKIKLSKGTVVAQIPHGISPDFLTPPRKQFPTEFYTVNNPFQVLYVSYITVYKHQWNVAKAVCQLHSEGYPIHLTLVGSVLDSYTKVEKVMNKYPNSATCITYLGGVPHKQLAEIYRQADSFLFASSCENMPIILLEAMSSGLPIASSCLGPMPEVLGSSGIYFDPYIVNDIKKAIVQLYLDHNLRTRIGQEAYNKTESYTWEICAEKTFNFLHEMAVKHKFR